MNYYLNRKRKKNWFSLRNSVYNQRVDNNVTKQFREIHDSIKNTDYITDEITDAQGLERSYADGNYYIHGNVIHTTGSHNLQDWYEAFTKIQAWGD